MSLPEVVSPVPTNKSVDSITWVSLVERGMSCDENEHNNSHCKKINAGSLVGSFTMDFRRHIALSTQLCVEISTPISPLHWSSKTKICYFKIKVSIIKNILGFQVSVGDSLLMHIV